MEKKIEQVENYLMTGNPLTVLDCFKMFNTFELRKIVCILKSKGLKINSEWQTNYQTKSRFKKYYLIN